MQIDNTAKTIKHSVQSKGGGVHEITVGGDANDDFHPEINLNFNNEDNLSIVFPELPPGWVTSVDDITGKLTITSTVVDVEIYMIDESRIEFAAILKQKPPGSKKSWSFNLSGWEAYDFLPQEDYSLIPGAIPVTFKGQPAWQIDEGGHIGIRPESICGGYCVYFKNKRDHIIGQTNYYTGKCLDINRPLFIDADGNEAYGDIDITAGVMTVSAPPGNWLNSAVYPVTIDPDLGYTGAGTSAGQSGSQFTYVGVIDKYTADGSETLTSASLSCDTDSGTEAVDLGVYTVDTAGDGFPDVLVDSATANNATTTKDWVTATITGSLTNTVDYAAGFENNATLNLNYYYDSGTAGDSAYESGVFPTPWTASTSLNRRMAVYATYSTGGLGIPIAAYHHNHNIGSNL